ncbi:hypothetical protein Tco_0096889 [Tanacetum coccineum]
MCLIEDEDFFQDDVVSEQVVKESSRKAEGRLKRKTSKARKDKVKSQKNQGDLEKLTLMEYVEVISDSKEVISVIPLAVKSSIVSWKSYCKEDVGYYEIHRADGSYKTYMFFSEMLNDFDREDLIVLYILFNEKYASTRPGFDDLMLWGDMKIMFEPNDDDVVWKNHHIEKKYPLPQDTLMRMLQWKLHVNYNVTEMAYELLRIFRYLKGQPKLGLWYPKDSPFDLVAYTDSDYAGESLDRKSTIGEGCLEWNEKAAKDEIRNGIGVNAGDSKLMLLGLTYCWVTTAVEIAFLEKPTESEGFEEIVDFLNANPIKYALTVNPTIYCSCIKQFWDTVKAKTVNGEVQLQALVDKKKVIITESTIRRDLQLEDANGVDCLPNAAIFE